MVQFMKGFYEIYTDLQGVDLFLAGESYCGRYIPHIARAFLNAEGIPLKVVMLGNALIDVVE